MFFFKNKKIKQDIAGRPALVFDFGTTSVKILLCYYLPERVEILAGKKVLYPPGTVSGEDFEHPEALLPKLREAIDILLEDKKMGPVTSAVVGIGGLGVEGYTSQINYRRAKSKGVIEEKEFRLILQRVEERANQIMRKLISWETAAGQEVGLMNSEILELTLDGYSVGSPVGSSGELVSFMVYNAYTKEQNLQKITRMLADLRLKLIAVGSSMYSTTRVVLETFGPDLSCLVLDIGGKTTEVGVIRSGRILGHSGFDVAGQSFSKSIADEFNRDLAGGEAIKLAFAGAKLPENDMKEVREIVAMDCKVFWSGVELILKEFPGTGVTADRMFVIGGGSLLPGTVSFLQSNLQQAQSLTPADLRGFADLTGRLNSPADVAMLCVVLDAADLIAEEGG